MKKNALLSYSSICVAVFAVSSLVISCNTPSQKDGIVKDEVVQAREELDKAREEFQAEMTKFKKESNEKISANEKLIADLKAVIKESKQNVKSQSAEQIAAAEKQNHDLKTRLAEFNDDSKEKWQSFKDEFNNDMYELGKSISNVTKDNVK